MKPFGVGRLRRIHIIGRKNSGKTTLLVDLVREFTRRGLRVGTIKHTHHQHELDAPGKDSYRHREAGAAIVGILSKSMNAVFWPADESEHSSNDFRYDAFAPVFADCSLVLVEGDTQTCGCKIEVWRAALDARPLAEEVAAITAVVTDDDLDLRVPVWPRSDVTVLIENILALVGVE